jgi:hypothetical protein
MSVLRLRATLLPRFRPASLAPQVRAVHSSVHGNDPNVSAFGLFPKDRLDDVKLGITSPRLSVICYGQWAMDNGQWTMDKELTLSSFPLLLLLLHRYHPPLRRSIDQSIIHCTPSLNVHLNFAPRSALRDPAHPAPPTDPLQGEGPEPLGKPGHLGTSQGARSRVERASRGESVGPVRSICIR